MNESIDGSGFNPIKSIKNTYNKTKKFITSGSERFTSKVENILHKVGNEQIQSIVVCRCPIPSMVQKALEIASLKQLEYNQLFHLFVIINGHVLLEKNSVINMQINPKLNGDMEHLTAPEPPNTTINQFIERCLHQMGPQKFFSYSSYNNNCQNFALNLLSSNGILTPDLSNFIKQNTESIFASNPTLRKLTNNITDLDGRAHEIMGGSMKDLQLNCVRNLTLEDLLSIIDHETGEILLAGLHPEANELIHERIRQLTRPTEAPRQTARKRMNGRGLKCC